VKKRNERNHEEKKKPDKYTDGSEIEKMID
jgi:hypothetical protein